MESQTFKPIPAFDLGNEITALKPQMMEAIESVLDQGAFIMGSNVKLFEQEAAHYLGVNYAISLNSGTDALMIALLSSGIGTGDEVITTPFTFFATAEAISRVGAAPVFVDIDPESYNIDLNRLEEAITPRTKAIIPVHLFGRPVDMERLMRIAGQYGLQVVEDAAQAFGAEVMGKKVGTIGDFGCFSFFPTKNLGAYGDGGLLVTNDPVSAERAAMLRAHGSKIKYRNELIGFNSRLDEMQAAILRVKLPYLDRWNEDRKQAASRYNGLLRDADRIVLPSEDEGSKHVFHQFTIRVLDGRRNELQASLAKSGVSTMIYYPLPLHKLPVYEAAFEHVQMPVAETFSQEALSLPIWPQIQLSVQEMIAQQIMTGLR